jgi:hypothetical protein
LRVPATALPKAIISGPCTGVEEDKEGWLMVRFRLVRQVRLGHFPQALEAADELSALHRDRGWPEGTNWIVVGGPVNTLITEIEFPSLAAMEEWQEAADADAEHVKLRQKAGEHAVEGSVRVEVLRTAPRLAR